MTIEEYIKFEEEKARRRGRVFNWQTDTYGKIRVDDGLYDLGSVEAEFPAIVIDDTVTPQDALPCKSQVSTPVNDEIDFRISFDESDDEDYTIIYDVKSKISLQERMRRIRNKPIRHMALPPREQRHRFLRYEGLEYSDVDIADFEAILARIYKREVHRVPVFDFEGLPDLMAERLSTRMLMEQQDDHGVSLFTSRAWRRLFDIRGLLFQLGGARRRMSWKEFILALGLHTNREMQTAGFGAYWADSARQNPDKGDLRDYWIGISSAGDFLGIAPSYTMIRDPILRLCHTLIAHNIDGRSQAPLKVLEILGGLTVIAPELPIIDMAELVRLQMCAQFDDTWAWVAMGLERQPDVAVGARAIAKDAPTIDEGDQAILEPVQAPQQPPPPPLAARIVPQRLGRLEEDVQGLRRDVGSLRRLVERSMTDQGRFSTWMMTCMTQLMDANGLAYQAFDGTF
ncbi:hypothetical protein Tco_1058767 [Tanacetum coccineum]|uniref:Uncharacterized protein n=1 Tax=Tanacetum coccineum TaxID=301880 RepID=A0ABQ5H970_9ASTR